MFSRELLSLAMLSALVTFASAQAREGCSRIASVVPGDTCDTFAARNSIPSYQLAIDNKLTINQDCSNLYPGLPLCGGLIGQDCTTVVIVNPGDTCDSISDALGISWWSFTANNGFDAKCDGIYPGQVVCIDPKIIDYTDR